jgi:long-chain fatty acid transport protein
MKKVFISIAAIAFSFSAFAGGFVTNTNQSARFLRNPARNASTEIDAIYSNPAGLSFMKQDGFYVSLNNQMAFQTRTITSTFAPFAANGGLEKDYKGTAKAFFIPSLQAAYKWKNWVFSGSFAIVGGGGTLEYKNGLPMFEAQVAMLPVMANGLLQQAGMPADWKISKYSLDQYLKGSAITYGTQLGANYKVKDMFSFFAGARASFVRNGYNGHIKNISVNPNIPPFGFSGDNMIPATDFVRALAAAHVIPQEQADALIAQVSDKAIDLKQSGWGITPILGVDFNYKNWNVGIKYEFNTKVNLTNKTKENTSGMADFDDGVKTRSDIPALLGAGVAYKFLKEKLIASAGFHLFFDKFAKMPNNKQELLKGGKSKGKGNSYEFMLGLEYVINDKFLVSTGGQITRLGLTDNFQSNMSFYCNSFSIGVGGAYTIIKNLTLNLSYMYTNFAKYTNDNPVYKHPVLGGKEVYARTSHAIGIGLDYKF